MLLCGLAQQPGAVFWVNQGRSRPECTPAQQQSLPAAQVLLDPQSTLGAGRPACLAYHLVFNAQGELVAQRTGGSFLQPRLAPAPGVGLAPDYVVGMPGFSMSSCAMAWPQHLPEPLFGYLLQGYPQRATVCAVGLWSEQGLELCWMAICLAAGRAR